MDWIVPIVSLDPFIIGAARVSLQTEESRMLRELYAGLHPRLLPLVKSRILPAEDSYCGTEEDLIDLAVPGDLVFDGEQLRISSCGEAFLHSLLSPHEIRALLQRAAISQDHRVYSLHQLLLSWNILDFNVVLIREG